MNSAILSTEIDVLNYWNSINAFQKSIENNKDCPDFIFYDGPPFATGLPHYGHLLASSIKDIIGRYWTMRGFRVERRFGWDTHGLPIEYEIEKKLGIKTPQQVEEMGIAKYNEECRGIVMKFRNEWRSTINRLGRWVDFDNDYKTMDTPFMESVWWVFSQLFKQGKVYQSVKVMPYSTGCHTPLSNFEAKSNYKQVMDPSIIIKFQAIQSNNNALHITLENYPVYFLVWTTTPWTLLSNLAICVNSNLFYVMLKVNYGHYQEGYILTKKCADFFIKNNIFKASIKNPDENAESFKPIIEIITSIKGDLLQNMKYVPLYNFFTEKYSHCFKVIADNYVSEENGTGIVHIAPAFGEDDFRVAKLFNLVNRNLEPPCPVDMNGCFTNEVGDEYLSVYFKDADPIVLNNLKSRNLLFSQKKESHEYPFCWRSETPLMYRTIKCWFIDVISIRDKLVANNKKINWVPKFIGENKFHDWLVNAQDWCISRNRYWGTPLPIWMSEDEQEIICIESIAQLESLSGLKPGSVTDLHRHNIDHIEIPSKREGMQNLKRCEYVADCWMESGCMPYAQFHYPFENKEKFEKNFPCDFIAEGSDQTRGWFYTLLVISTLLFDKPAFKNVIVNGLVLAEDGEKMSKMKQNYPPANLILDKYGADALRLYMIDSKVVRGDSLCFKEEDLKIITKGIHLMFKNMTQYWIETKDYFNKMSNQKWQLLNVFSESENYIKLDNPLDSWILHSLATFLTNLHTSMEKYELHSIVSSMTIFIDHLSRWYIKLNKNRFRNIDDKDKNIQTKSLYDVQIGLSVLFECLFQFSLALAPFAPFLSEIVYQTLKFSEKVKVFKDSVHFERLSTKFFHTIDTNMDLSMTCLIRVVNLVRHQRSTREKFQSIKMPYQKVILVHNDLNILQALKSVEHILKDEINIIDIEYQNTMAGCVDYTLAPNLKILGPKLGNELKLFIKYLSNIPADEIDQWVEDRISPFYWYERKIDREDIIVRTSPKKEFSTWQVVPDNDLIVLIDPEVTDSLLSTYYLKQFTRQAQDFRRKNGLVLGDYAVLHYSDIDNNKYFTNNFINQNIDQIEFLVGKIESDINVVDIKTMKKIAECQLLLDTERNGKNDPNPEKISLALFIES